MATIMMPRGDIFLIGGVVCVLVRVANLELRGGFVGRCHGTGTIDVFILRPGPTSNKIRCN
jgi:hypothetical protein